MKKISLIAFVTFVFTAYGHAQESPYIVKGKIAGWPTEQAYLVRQGNYPGADSAVVSNGVFEFKGTIAGPTIAYLITKKKGGMAKFLFVEPGSITVEGNFEAFKDVKITGSPAYREFELLRDGHDVYDKQMNDNILLQVNTTDSLELKSIYADMEKIGLADLEFSKKFIQEHPHSPVSVMEIKNLVNRIDKYALKKLYDSLNETIKQSPDGKKLLQEIENTVAETAEISTN